MHQQQVDQFETESLYWVECWMQTTAMSRLLFAENPPY